MRFDTTSGASLGEFLASATPAELVKILRDYGEERNARGVAERICRRRDAGTLESSTDLAEAISPGRLRGKSRIHPATRAFQALRIALNREMERLDEALRTIPVILQPGGRFCVVSYHSLEDRKVKWGFRERASLKEGWLIVTKRPIRPSREEVLRNPRSRSGRLRVIQAPGTQDEEKGTPRTD
jgi:16S rRNA (cytosine1402-N4)-methyltransferase